MNLGRIGDLNKGLQQTVAIIACASRSHYLMGTSTSDWLSDVEKFFDVVEVPEQRRVKLVVICFKGGASAWWDQLVANRARHHKLPVRTWRKMKTLLRACFLPSNYENVLFTRYQNCKQEFRSVSEYTEEFHRLSSRNNLQESEDQLIARFVGV